MVTFGALALLQSELSARLILGNSAGNSRNLLSPTFVVYVYEKWDNFTHKLSR